MPLKGEWPRSFRGKLRCLRRRKSSTYFKYASGFLLLAALLSIKNNFGQEITFKTHKTGQYDISNYMTNKQAIDPIAEYRKLRLKIDEEVKRLEELHGADITCHSGCTACCVNLTVFPVEFFAMLEDLKEAPPLNNNLIFDESIPCGFLNEIGICRIYPFRPIICRTHGLPILFLNESQEAPAWEVSFCEFNFRNKSGIEFTDEMLLDIETINAELNHINDRFITAYHEKGFLAQERIPLKSLCESFKNA